MGLTRPVWESRSARAVVPLVAMGEPETEATAAARAVARTAKRDIL